MKQPTISQLTISTVVPSTIFEYDIVAAQEFKIFELNNQLLLERIGEVLNSVQLKACDTLSYLNIINTFKKYFHEFILNKVVTLSFTSPINCNIVENLLTSLNTDTFKEALYGKPMIDSICYVISTIPTFSATEATLYGMKSLSIRKTYSYL